MCRSSGCVAKGKGGRYTDEGCGIKAVCIAGVTGVVPVSAEDDAMLFGGLGIEGKKPSPLGRTVPLVGNVGDPAKEEEFDLVNLSVSRASCVMISRHHMVPCWT